MKRGIVFCTPCWINKKNFFFILQFIQYQKCSSRFMHFILQKKIFFGQNGIFIETCFHPPLFPIKIYFRRKKNFEQLMQLSKAIYLFCHNQADIFAYLGCNVSYWVLVDSAICWFLFFWKWFRHLFMSINQKI